VAIEYRLEVDLNISARTGCFIAIGFGLVLIALLWLVFLLAVQGEISMQAADLTGFRLWVIRSDSRSGLGLSRTRNVSSAASAGDRCVETTTRYLLFRTSPPEPVSTYCECYLDQGGQWQYVGECEP
jgi:hypothetical protein